MPRALVVAPLLAVLLIGGCDDGGPSAPNPLSSDYLPMAEGDRWVYEVDRDYGTPDPLLYEEMVTVAGTRRVGEADATVLQTRDVFSNALLEESLVHRTEDHIEELYAPAFTLYGEPVDAITQLHLPLKAGDQYLVREWRDVPVGYDVDGDGIEETLDTTLTVKVEASGPVSGPAGTWRQVIKVTTLLQETSVRTGDGTSRVVSVRTEEWLAPGVGMVKSLETFTAGDLVKRELRQLKHFRIGAVSSEVTPPVPSSPSPAAGSTITAWPDLGLALDEPLDQGRVGELTFTVVSGDGVRYPGKAVVENRRVKLLLGTPLPPGDYTATVQGVFDLVGNALPPQSWDFSVSAPEPDALSDSYLPMAVGDRWINEVAKTVTTYGDEGSVVSDPVFTETETVTGEELTGEGLVRQFGKYNALDGADLGSYRIVRDEYGVSQLLDKPVILYGQPTRKLPLLRLPLRGGDDYEIAELTDMPIDADLDGDGVNEAMRMVMRVRVGMPQSVNLPAGWFADAMLVTYDRVRTITGSRYGNEVSVSYQTQEWLAPWVGMVQKVAVESSDAREVRTTANLMGYRVGTLRSELSAPFVVARTPDATGGSAPTDFRLTFNEMLDPARVDTGDLVVSGADGEPVPGTLAHAGRDLVFTPAQVLAEGNYTITLSEAVDLVGNARSNTTWTYTVDNVKPVVLSASLADGATGVPTGETIVFRLSEPVQPGFGTILLRQPDGQKVDASVFTDGNEVTIQPSRLLEHGTRYTVNLTTDVTDRYGNGLAETYTVGFTTLPALFSTPIDIPGWAQVEAVAIGDVNGDQRNDLVAVTSLSWHLSGIDEYSLFIMLQRADGTLAAPEKRSTTVTDTCSPVSVAIGDVTGDGNSDIVVGEGGCGMKILERSDTGDWPLPVRTVTTDGTRLRIADIDGDGRLDLVGLGQGVSVWYQQPAGGLGVASRYAMEPWKGTDLAIGDINGDGRRDIVVCSTWVESTQSITVLRQQAAGGFGAPTNIGTGNTSSNVAGCATGDTDHDGRDDIVVTLLGSAVLGRVRQQADGSLGTLERMAIRNPANAVELADLNGDGRNDLLVNHVGYDRVGVLLQDLAGNLLAEDTYAAPTDSRNPDTLALGDLNGDGWPDAVVGNSQHISVLYNVGR